MSESPRRAEPQPRQLPQGTKDLFDGPARRLTRLSQALYTLWQGWGYAPIMPPIFEYFENLVYGYGDARSAELYRLVDPQGQLLALRPDLTVPIARIAATKLAAESWPRRFCYVAPVFRYVEPQAGRQREFWQAGAELIGADSPDADAEMVALLIASLQHGLGLPRFQVNLGHMGFLRAILADAALSEGQQALLMRAIDRKNSRSLAQGIEAVGLRGPVAEALAALPELWGGPEVLTAAAALTPNRAAAVAIERLQAVYDRLIAYGVAEWVTLDLGEVRGMDYYTGVAVEVYAPGSGYALAGAGRYDGLLRRFGDDRAAVGFAIQIERAMLVLDQQQGEELPLHPAALAESCGHATCLAVVATRRAAGEVIELDVLGRSAVELEAEATRRGIAEVLRCGEE